jgi:hypothetical protein
VPAEITKRLPAEGVSCPAFSVTHIVAFVGDGETVAEA